MAADQEPSSSSTCPEAEMEVASPITPVEKEEALKVALNALVQGKRHLLVKDITSAISSLGEACRLITEVYGPVAPENAEAHFYYGKALLEQSRLDLAVFIGPENAKAESEAEEESEEEAEGSEEQEEEGSDEENNEAESKTNGEEKEKKTAEGAGEVKMDEDVSEKEMENGAKELKEGDKTVETENESKDMEVDGEAAEVAESKISENGEHKGKEGGATATATGAAEEDLNVPSPSEGGEKEAVTPSEEKPSTSKGVQEGEEAVEADAEEELGNLQLAWEVLEVAKVAYGKKLYELKETVALAGGDKTDDAAADADAGKSKSKEIKELQKKLADTHLLLGEVATESEMYVEAVGEFKTGLMILTRIEEPDSREIAQYYFQIGLAYAFAKSFDDAICSFKKSMEIIEQRISNLTEKQRNAVTSENKENEAKAEEKSAELKEIEELKALLPELQEKINDTIDAENDSKKTKEEESKEQEIIMRNSPVKNPNPPVANDISHLVKKRKKTEEGVEVEPPSKRICNLFPQPQQDDVSSSTTTTNGNKTDVSA